MSSPLNGAEGLIGNSGRNTADACDTNASEMSVDTTAHFISLCDLKFELLSQANFLCDQIFGTNVCFLCRFNTRPLCFNRFANCDG